MKYNEFAQYFLRQYGQRNSYQPGWSFLTSITAILKILPHLDKHFAKSQNANPQEMRSHISGQIQREIFFGILISKAQTAKNSTDLVQALCKLASSTSEAA